LTSVRRRPSSIHASYLPAHYALAHVLGGEPATTPHQVRGRLSPGHALAGG
jgi:hypothetical protein